LVNNLQDKFLFLNAIAVFIFILCTSQDAFEQKLLAILFLELFLFLSPISIYRKLVLTQLVAHAVMAFQTISNKQKNKQTNSQTDKQSNRQTIANTKISFERIVNEDNLQPSV
jgi:hypothetical protein